MKTHAKHKIIECNFSGKKFSGRGLLEDHLKIHTLKNENVKSIIEASLHTQLNEIKEQDENITISCTSNERTPMNYFQLKNANNISNDNSPNPNAKHQREKLENEGATVYNSQLLNLMKIPKNIEQSTTRHNTQTFTNPLANLDETPTRTPLSRMESKIKQCINNGQETIQYDEALHLLEFYNNCFNKYLNVYNDNKYVNFFTNFNEFMANKQEEEISLNKLLNLLTFNKIYLNELNTVNAITNAMNNAHQVNPTNTNINNLMNYVMSSPKIITPNSQDIASINLNNIRSIIDSSPRFPTFGNTFTNYSPLWHNANLSNFSKFNNVNSTTSTNIHMNNNNNSNTHRNTFSVPRTTNPHNPTFSDYLNLYK
jgi:hypothetical protein